MKIKKPVHYKTNSVHVEFDEFFQDSHCTHERQKEIIEFMDAVSGSTRIAYNIWKFKTEEEARQALFLLGLKR